jgi:hypothetical protein
VMLDVISMCVMLGQNGMAVGVVPWASCNSSVHGDFAPVCACATYGCDWHAIPMPGMSQPVQVKQQDQTTSKVLSTNVFTAPNKLVRVRKAVRNFAIRCSPDTSATRGIIQSTGEDLVRRR